MFAGMLVADRRGGVGTMHSSRRTQRQGSWRPPSAAHPARDAAAVCEAAHKAGLAAELAEGQRGVDSHHRLRRRRGRLPQVWLRLAAAPPADGGASSDEARRAATALAVQARRVPGGAHHGGARRGVATAAGAGLEGKGVGLRDACRGWEGRQSRRQLAAAEWRRRAAVWPSAPVAPRGGGSHQVLGPRSMLLAVPAAPALRRLLLAAPWWRPARSLARLLARAPMQDATGRRGGAAGRRERFKTQRRVPNYRLLDPFGCATV